jgi:hypothetical protein
VKAPAILVVLAVVVVLGLVFAFRGTAFHEDPATTTTTSMSEA